MNVITIDRNVVQQGLEALVQIYQRAATAETQALSDAVLLLSANADNTPEIVRVEIQEVLWIRSSITALRAALAQQENKMPITDDHGKALLPQYQVIEQRGNWVLLYDQMQVGEKVRHEFRIQKLRHDVALYPGTTLSEALKRFHEKVGADHE